MNEPVEPIPQVENGQGKPPSPPPETPKPSEPLDKEPLIRAAEQSITDFFNRASLSTSRIGEYSDAIQGSRGQLEGSQEAASQVHNQLRGQDNRSTDYQIEEVEVNISQISSRLQEQAEDLGRRFSASNKSTELLDFIQQQDNTWMQGGGLDQFTTELREAANEPDVIIREQKLALLRGQVLALAQRIDEDGGSLSVEFSLFKEDTRNNRDNILSRGMGAIETMQHLREQFPDTHWSIMNKLEVMQEGAEGFYHRVEQPLENMPLEYQMLSQAANELGVGMGELIDLLKKGD